jgi:hypothetical protein
MSLPSLQSPVHDPYVVSLQPGLGLVPGFTGQTLII